MEQISLSNSESSSDSSAERRRGGSGRPRLPQPNYSSPSVWEALEYMASIHPFELCHEAKVEHCRATRDLSSCGRYVQHVLGSCRHASLCAECSQRCDVCPICRTSISAGKGDQRRLRLYNKCIEAGLISKRHDDRLHDKQNDRKHLLGDIQRLFLLFDVALENNLVSLVCHYVTDVCMDEAAVSSDPMLAYLLDAKVVKDWCKQKFDMIISDLGNIYAVSGDTENRLASISKFGLSLSGLSNVLEVLVSSSIQAPAGQLDDLHHLLDCALKAKQHLEVMVWCTRHNYLKDISTRHSNSISWWCTQVQERKSAAANRAWPDSGNSLEYNGSTLFIEDALVNLGIEHSEDENWHLNISCLEEDPSPSSPSNCHGLLGLYPFRSLRSAVDILFLRGTSDMVVAKQAIFLYYLFDQHWDIQNNKLWNLIDDFAASFGIVRHSVLESLLFYLLDDHSDQALLEAVRLLPEVIGPDTHPKIAQVLLQRQRPDIALLVLRCSGQDGFSSYTNTKAESAMPVSLGEAVTALRVRVECGLLTAAFMYLRMHCTKVKQEKTKQTSHIASASKLKNEPHSWMYQVEVLVSELCSLCIRRNLVDRMIELPWNADEEKYLCKCLYNDACQNPSLTSGSLLVVFFLQRYRYIEAYKFDRKLRELENNFSGAYEVQSRMRQMSQWRAGLVDRSIELLPEVQRLQLKAEKLDDIDLFSSAIVDSHPNIASSTGRPPDPITMGTLSMEPPIILQPNRSSLLLQQTPAKSNVKAASSEKIDTGIHSPAAPPALGDTAFNFYRSPASYRRTSSFTNGAISTTTSNGDYSASRSILTKGFRMQSDTKKVAPHQTPATIRKQTHQAPPSFRKQTPFSVSDDVNRVNSRSSIRKGADELELNARGGMRWRTDESSEEEMDMDIERILVDREGSMLTHKRR